MLAVSVESSLSLSNAPKLVTKRRFTGGNLSLTASKMRRAIVMAISAGRNMFSATSKPLTGIHNPPKICHSRRGSSFTFPAQNSRFFWGTRYFNLSLAFPLRALLPRYFTFLLSVNYNIALFTRIFRPWFIKKRKGGEHCEIELNKVASFNFLEHYVYSRRRLYQRNPACHPESR